MVWEDLSYWVSPDKTLLHMQQSFVECFREGGGRRGRRCGSLGVSCRIKASKAGRKMGAEHGEGRFFSGDSIGARGRVATMMKSAKVRSEADRSPAATKGVVIARKNRAQCNSLTNEQRAALVRRAMVTIYGGPITQASACRR